MRIVLSLIDPDAALSVDIDARDTLAAEMSCRKDLGLPPGALDALVASSPMTYTAWLAWHAARRDDPSLPAFRAWAERVVHLEAVSTDKAADLGDPTPPGPGPG